MLCLRSFLAVARRIGERSLLGGPGCSPPGMAEPAPEDHRRLSGRFIPRPDRAPARRTSVQGPGPARDRRRQGGGGSRAADAVAKARDDHTIGLMMNGNLTIAKQLTPALPYGPLQDFAPLSLIGTAPLVLTAPVDPSGVSASARDFFAAARKGGDRWSYGTPGVGTVGHIGTELLKSRSRINPVHVPYPGYAQVASALLGGQLQMALLPPALAQAQVRAGKLRAIGVTSAGRSLLAPELP